MLGFMNTITPFKYQQAIDKSAQKRAAQRGEDEADDSDYAAARAAVDASLRSRGITVKKSWFGADFVPASNRVIWLALLPMGAVVVAGAWMLLNEG